MRVGLVLTELPGLKESVTAGTIAANADMLLQMAAAQAGGGAGRAGGGMPGGMGGMMGGGGMDALGGMGLGGIIP